MNVSYLLESISVYPICLVHYIQYVIFEGSWIFGSYWISFACRTVYDIFPAGSTVKNLSAFHLLQSSLMRSQDSLLCCQLLRTLQTIWEKDPTNFFLLEWTVQTMRQLSACVREKPASVQKLFFSLLEMVWLLMLLLCVTHHTRPAQTLAI